MIVPSQAYLNDISPWGWWSRGTDGTPTAWDADNRTSHDLTREWLNPSVVVGTVLMLCGSHVIRGALAQASGTAYTPVCFSFGWVAYAFDSLVEIFGDGRLLPKPDYPAKVFALTSKYVRENRNWVVGRIVRDHQAWVHDKEPLLDNKIRITVYDVKPQDRPYHFRYTRLHVYGMLTVLVQLVIASIPTILTAGEEWGILLVTAVGTLLAVATGRLPQWKAEKLPNGFNSKETYALTAGNGSRDIIIIQGMGHCMRLEEFAAHESPKFGTPWLKFRRFSAKERQNTPTGLTKEIGGVPQGFFITMCAALVLAACWVMVFITIPGLEGHTWALLLVGGVGLLHNTVVAGMKRKPKERNLPLVFRDSILTRNIMDGLMDLEVSYPGCGAPLVREFIPGEMSLDERQWWEAEADSRPLTRYDQERYKDRKKRRWPRSMQADQAAVAPAVPGTSRAGPPVVGSRQPRAAAPRAPWPVQPRQTPSIEQVLLLPDARSRQGSPARRPAKPHQASDQSDPDWKRLSKPPVWD